MSQYDSSNMNDRKTVVNLEDMVNKISKEESRELYSKLRNEREKTTFSMMMKMNPEALTAVRKEFFMREDKVKLPEFIYIIQKHLSGGTSSIDDDLYAMQTNEKREFGLNMCELFKEIDVNGDGDLEWQEFTQFVVEKANILNKRLKMTSIAHYSENTNYVDSASVVRHRHDATSMIDIAPLGLVALVEDHKNQIFILNAARGQYIQNNPGDIKTDAAPLAIAYLEENHTLVASLSNMTMCSYSLDNPNPNKKYKTLSTWATPGVQMAVTYMPKNRLLYSGATTGDIYSWKIKERKICDTLSGHNDMVMSLVTLPKLNYLASASLDKTVSIWDAYTNQQLLRLYGHKKGILDIDYSCNYRLLVSAGFEHDACIWSPFVNTLVYRLKGHHHSLVGCQAIKDTPEIITADASGVLKLWDIRNFQCVQSFDANLSGQEVKDGSKLGCFLQCNLPSKGVNAEDDSRIYAASKVLFVFDQMRVVHDATTDYSNVLWMTWDKEHMTIITASERNVMIWDALIGSKTTTVNNICGHEISACCLDDRKRKIVIGDVSGAIAVYNAASGGVMKTCCHDIFFIVVSLQYIDDVRRFIAAYKNGVIRLYDESGLEDCHLLTTFETSHSHLEVLNMVYNHTDLTVATVGASCDTVQLWDYHAGKLEKELDVCDETEHVVQIFCLAPYPIVATSDSSGNILLFGSRGCKWAGKRVSGFMNQTPLTAEYEEVISLSSEQDEPPLRAMIFQGGKSGTPVDILSRRGSGVPIENIGSIGMKMTGVFSEAGSDSDDDSAGDDAEEWQSAIDFLDRRATEETVRHEFIQAEVKWGKVTPAQAIGWDEGKCQMYTVDALGNLRSFCLKDVMADMKKTFNLRGRNNKKNVIGDICKKRHHCHMSAMPPYPQKGKSYLLGSGSDATSYLGVRFNWSVEAHASCILSCKAIPDGVLTSAADKLVKMWSFQGQPLGILIQSVPEGTRSRLWSLRIDVEPAMERESHELDDVIAQVHELVIDPEKPELDGFNFYGIEPGENSTAFSRSELRQRIEKTSTILGVDFAVNNCGRAFGGDFSDFNESALAKFSSIPFEGQMDLTKFDEEQKEIKDRDGKRVRTSSEYVTAKTFGSALQELKSSDAAIDFKSRNQGLSKLQLRRKATKMEDISCLHETKTGIKISLSETGNLARSALSKTLNGDGVEYRASSSIRAKSGHQKTIKSNKVFVVESAQDTGIVNLLSLNSASTESNGYKSRQMTPSAIADEKHENSKYENQIPSRVQSPHLTQPLSSFQATTYNTQNPNNTQNMNSTQNTQNTHSGHGKGGFNNSRGSVSSGLSGTSGSRSKLIVEACSKFSSFSQMESLLTAPINNKVVLPLHPKDLEKLNKIRENKKIALEKALA